MFWWVTVRMMVSPVEKPSLARSASWAEAETVKSGGARKSSCPVDRATTILTKTIRPTESRAMKDIHQNTPPRFLHQMRNPMNPPGCSSLIRSTLVGSGSFFGPASGVYRCRNGFLLSCGYKLVAGIL